MSLHASRNLRELFLEAVEIEDTHARAGFLDRVCGEDANLRRRLEELLAADQAAGPAPALPAPADPHPGEGVGSVIGRYKLLQQIGVGGCGIVYMAEQVEPVRRRVALKIIKLGMDTRSVIARFEAERQALALMDHPNIAKVHDAGATENGRPYFVMELVRGIKITDYCDQNNLSTRERLDLFVQVCDAVQHAHQKGVIHRDLKPSNILVTQRDEVPVPKVIDFGIAKAITDQRLTDKTLFTAFEQFLGTPAYMSPEQAELSELGTDTRSDIYSLGVLLYELLTGSTPFDTQDLLKAGLDEMRRTIREKEPASPSSRLTQLQSLVTRGPADQSKIKNLKSKIPSDLDWIVMKCLEKDRSRRYATANGLATDVRRHLSNEPVVARPPSGLYRLQKVIRRNKLLCGAIGAVGTVLVLAVVVSTWQAREQNRLRRMAEQANRNATEKLWGSYLAEARARRYSRQAGQRFESLAALSNAAAIRPSLELRNEAIACLALADIRVLERRSKRFKHNQEFAQVDPALERYALGDTNGEVTIRRISDDKELMRLPRVGGGAVRPPEFSPNGKLLVAAYADKRQRVWDLDSGTVTWDSTVRGLYFGPRCERMATFETNTLEIYDWTQRRKIKAIAVEGSALGPGIFHPDGRLFAYRMDDTNIVVLDTESEKRLSTLVHPHLVYGISWHPAGRYLATPCYDGTVYIWDGLTGQRVRTLEGHHGSVVSLDFTHDGSLLASAGWDGRTVLWDFASGRQLVGIAAGGGISFGPDDRTLAARAWDLQEFDFLEVAHGREVLTIHERGMVPGPPGGGAVFSAHGEWLAYEAVGGIVLYDVRAQRELGAISGSLGLWGFEAGDRSVLGVEVGNDGVARVFRWPIERLGSNQEVKVGPMLCLGKEIAGIPMSLTPDGKVGSACGEDRCQILRTDTFTEQARTGIQRGMRFGALSPDGKLVATGAFHYYGVNIWDAHTGKLVKTLPTKEDITTVAFSPDSRQLVTGGTSGTEYQFWDAGNWSLELRIPQPHDSGFAPVMAFSPDGKILAGTFGFTKVRLFNATTGEILGVLERPDSWTVTSLSFSPDGTQLAVCEGKNALHLWDLRTIRQELAQMHLDWDLPPYPTKPVALKR
jgi:serine/threonine protein kinase/WD40 repeat protein